MTVTHKTIGTAFVITIDNGKPDWTGPSGRSALMAALDTAEQAKIDRVILTDTNNSFAVGSTSQDYLTAPVAPLLADITTRIENFSVPCIAALNGPASDEGLEIALACRYRVATPKAKLSLPAATLGSLPQTGATQRLPRLVGMGLAMEMAAQGKVIIGAKAADLGLVEAVDNAPLDVALTLAENTLADTTPVSVRPAPAANKDAEANIRAALAKRAAHQIAPVQAIDLVTAAANTEFAVAAKREQAAYLALRNGHQARALRHMNVADNSAKNQIIGGATTPVEVIDAVVVGGGNMGASIAYSLALVGIKVTLVEANETGAAQAANNVKRLYDQAVKRGRMDADTAGSALKSHFNFVIGYDALPAAQIAIEAAFEDMEVKKTIFAALDAALPKTTVLATNTSYLDVNQIAQDISNPERVMGLHFFSPAHIMKLLEVVCAAETSDAVMNTALRLAQRLGKISVKAGVCDGFIGNRILTRYRQVTDIMMIEGALPWEIDTAMREFGMAMGPYEVQDLSGLDIAYANRKRLGLKSDANFRYIPIADKMVEDLARLGRKTNAGWNDYPAGAAPAPSPIVETLIKEIANEAGIPQRKFTEQEIQTRALTAMIEEACHILSEGIAKRPADIDLVLVHGYAFPRWRGGLMHFADSMDPLALLDRIEAYAAQDPKSWSSPEILRQLVLEKQNFASLN